MATYSVPVTTNQKQEAAITTIVAKVNERRAADVPPKPAFTHAEYLEHVMNQAIKSYRQEYEHEQSGLISNALPTATDAQIAQIKTLLGI